MIQRHRHHDILVKLVAYPSEVLVEVSHPALVPDDKKVCRWSHFLSVSDEEGLVLCGVTTSTLSMDANLRLYVGDMCRGGDLRWGDVILLAAVPPRQCFGVVIEAFQPEPFGLVLIHGWRLPEAEYRRLWGTR